MIKIGVLIEYNYKIGDDTIKEIIYLDLFSGVGATHESFTQLEGENKVKGKLLNYCEYEDYIARMYSALHDIPKEMNLGDITKVDETKLSDFDLMTYGFPCQDISMLGNQVGFFDENGNSTRSGLLFEALRIARHKKPRVLIAENVKALVNKNNIDNFNLMIEELKKMGYKSYWKVMDAKKYGIPHSRQRVFIVSIRKDLDDNTYEFPVEEELTSVASDYYDPQEQVLDDLYINERQIEMYAKNEMRIKKQYSSLNKDITICQTTKQGQRSNSQNFIEDNKGIRIMSGNEVLKLQGFRDGCGHKLREKGFTTSQIGFVSGNSLYVGIMKKLILSIEKYIV